MARSFKQMQKGDNIKGPKYVKKSKEKFKSINRNYYEQDEEDEDLKY